MPAAVASWSKSPRPSTSGLHTSESTFTTTAPSPVVGRTGAGGAPSSAAAGAPAAGAAAGVWANTDAVQIAARAAPVVRTRVIDLIISLPSYFLLVPALILQL